MTFRCICPGETGGSKCSILSRTFQSSDSFIWIQSLPTCYPLRLSFYFHSSLSSSSASSILLYSGPLNLQKVMNYPEESDPFLLLFLKDSSIHLKLKNEFEFLTLTANFKTNHNWHFIETSINNQVNNNF